MKKIAIAAATGNIGKRVAQQISKQHARAVLLGQNIDRLNNLKISGGIPMVTDISNRDQMISATKDVDSLFILVPPVLNASNYKEWYEKTTNAGVAAVVENKIKKVVLISSLGATTAPNQGTIGYCGNMEVAFDNLEANVLALRPGYFMENLLLQADEIKNSGSFSFPYDENHDIPFISADDIGDVASRYLLDETWSGHWKLNLMGPENITPKEIAKRLTVLTNKRITYVRQSLENLKAQLKNWGISGTTLQEMLELYQALGDPQGPYATTRTPEATTPTSFEQFVKNKMLAIL
jgi:uncharacterized protein YbjT (DUF2867 family)